MREIKTVTAPIEKAEWFDTSINGLLADRWQLKKREIMYVSGELTEAFNAPIIRLLYAELERNVPPFPDEITV